MDNTLLIDGPADGATLVLAHGAGAPMDSPFMDSFAHGLAERGLRVVRFEFPYMARRRTENRKFPPDRQPRLLAHWRAVIDHLGGPAPLVIGGKSMGGRMATLVAADLEHAGTPVRGVVCLGYPFHAPGRSEPRIAHFESLATPTLICQGSRDSMGKQDEVTTYPLPATTRLHWLEDGDHDLKPRVASGRTMKQNHQEAMDAVTAFMGRLER
ncbi:alpha/beta fold hydrolase [Roseospirillum parvum]|uniref:KANL3/Tex30 alpha/beta hydrolase-like domain-containing protein n=1 Tax=Roseospirillum parvum TaxID=83401 RepID=A0A1G7UIK9_9PROT|nr:alpha/beta fold hydrolase [Roseospirillum parvum]SDG47386.1 hypothetical protein SAMN05421742_101342 [Roseospirillum parvum]